MFVRLRDEQLVILNLIQSLNPAWILHVKPLPWDAFCMIFSVLETTLA